MGETVNITLPANWKTTLAGALASGAALIMFLGQPPYNVHIPAWLMGTAAFVLVGGIGGLGLAAKDSNVTGGTKVQPGIPVAPVPPVVQPVTPAVSGQGPVKWGTFLF